MNTVPQPKPTNTTAAEPLAKIPTADGYRIVAAPAPDEQAPITIIAAEHHDL
ncbi:hypothetical protein [Corynebacterium sp. 13CS0277]|uniref:hypothetical protein n=1 Tax=Corynebacterium sp. 13CS0277 TaxID=2071994 RepID=UPI001304BCBC|nr:hypothetical protein [Corynebacterium sp. 13CS0277]